MPEARGTETAASPGLSHGDALAGTDTDTSASQSQGHHPELQLSPKPSQVALYSKDSLAAPFWPRDCWLLYIGEELRVREVKG